MNACNFMRYYFEIDNDIKFKNEWIKLSNSKFKKIPNELTHLQHIIKI